MKGSRNVLILNIMLMLFMFFCGFYIFIDILKDNTSHQEKRTTIQTKEYQFIKEQKKENEILLPDEIEYFNLEVGKNYKLDSYMIPQTKTLIDGKFKWIDEPDPRKWTYLGVQNFVPEKENGILKTCSVVKKEQLKNGVIRVKRCLTDEKMKRREMRTFKKSSILFFKSSKREKTYLFENLDKNQNYKVIEIE